MKICPACHLETFDGRSTCHRCGSDVSQTRSLDLPTADQAIWRSRIPFKSKKGVLHLEVSGVRLESRSGQELLNIPTRQIHDIEAQGIREMILFYKTSAGDKAQARFRVGWAPNSDINPGRQRRETVMVGLMWRTVMVSGGRRKRSQRDKEVVRDRWLSSIRALLNSDRYAVGRREPVDPWKLS